MSLSTRVISMLVFSVVCVGSVLAQVPQPQYTCQRAIDTITADGQLNEATWQYASSTANAVIAGSSTPAPDPMTVQLAWDDDYLYAAFTVADSDLYATIDSRDDSTWSQDNVEMFIWLQDPQAGDNDPDYVEFEWSPAGQIWDGLFDGRMSGMNPYDPASLWNSEGLELGAMTLGTLNDASDIDTGFIVEVAIPWSDIYYHNAGEIPTDGTDIRMNFCRITWDTPENPQAGSNATGMAGSNEYYTWSPLERQGAFFHQANEFGTVTFSTESVPEPATLTLLALTAPLLRRKRR